MGFEWSVLLGKGGRRRVPVGMERVRRNRLRYGCLRDSGIASLISESKWANTRNLRSSPVVPKDQHRFVASSESALGIMRSRRLREMVRATSRGSEQRPCCLDGIEDIGGANGR